jgi:hypothetical protein
MLNTDKTSRIGQIASAAVVVLSALGLWLCGLHAHANATPVTDRYASVSSSGYEHRPYYVAEDAPGWDCRIDGNQRCGNGFVDVDGYVVPAGYYGITPEVAQ